MEISVKPQVYAACRMFMRPIASLLMRYGMTWKEFAELCKSVFVEVASEEYGIKGRKTNVSRTAILTGMSRKEVKRQRDLLESEEAVASGKTTDATRVLSGWHQDQDFLDDRGQPLDLPIDGESPSFVELLSRYGGDIPHGVMLKALKDAKAIEEQASGKLKVVSRHYMPVQVDPALLLVGGVHLQDHAATLNHNLSGGSNGNKRFEGRADNDMVDASVLPEFRAFMDEEGQKFLEKLDNWLAQRQVDRSGGTNKKAVRLGVGLYAIEDTTNPRGRK